MSNSIPVTVFEHLLHVASLQVILIESVGRSHKSNIFVLEVLVRLFSSS